jgi:hypothetical protein
MINYRTWLAALLVFAGLACADEAGITSVDLDKLEAAAGHASSGQPTAAQLKAQAEGADYVGCGPVFETPTKSEAGASVDGADHSGSTGPRLR